MTKGLLLGVLISADLAATGCNGRWPQVAPAVPAAHTATRPFTAPGQRSQVTPLFKSIYSFKGGSTDGGIPGGLTNVAGVLYGTTSAYPINYSGSVFSITTSGQEQVLYKFAGRPSDGADPGPSSMIVLNGVLYGTTYRGGNGSCLIGHANVGCGTVFSVTTSGEEKVIYSFQGGSHDGAQPNGLIAVRGVLYGTTVQGGSSGCGGFGCGTVFSLTVSGQEKILYSFKTFSDGNYPSALLHVNGTFYGTTVGGGYCSSGACGTFFSLTKSGQEKVLYDFQGYPNDGAGPQGSLIDVNGTLYGVTTSGGGGGLGFCDSPLGACGTVYSITTSGQEHLLHSFGGPYGDGAFPVVGLIVRKGVLYGTTYEGGSDARNQACHDRYGYPVGCGTVFSITTSGQTNILYSFSGGTDGGYPYGSLAVVKRMLYGTTTSDGANKLGTVFKLRP